MPELRKYPLLQEEHTPVSLLHALVAQLELQATESWQIPALFIMYPLVQDEHVPLKKLQEAALKQSVQFC